MRIVIGASHNGYHVKSRLVEVLKQLGHEVADVGVCDSRPVDYPDVAFKVAGKVSRGEAERGILLGGAGIGMTIAANKFPGVRAALCHDDMTAAYARRHTDSNVLCLATVLLGERLILRLVEIWLETPFDGGRHLQRLEKLTLLEHEERLGGGQ
ncbi:MAG: ribose 5-phosphate isomerase B [Thermoguttaceae bacterium]